MQGSNGRPRPRTLVVIPVLLVLAALAALTALTGAGLPDAAAQAWNVSLSPIRAPSAILLEANSGMVLYEQNADLPRAPASIVKLMLELIALERVTSGDLSLSDSLRVSATASKIGGSQVYLKEGEVFTLEELLKAVTISSANDACVVIAEHIAGSAEGFVDLMNLRAAQLGLTQTRYVNVHGLDDEPGAGNVTTARDIAAIARRLVRMPHVLEFSGTREEPFRNGTFKLQNTNHLLGDFEGLDGLKTGYTHRAGFCLCATAQRKGLRLISVVMGADSNRERFKESARLLGAGFAQLRCETLIAAADTFATGLPVRGGHPRAVRAVAGEPLVVLLPHGMTPPEPVLVPLARLQAPIAAGDTLGVLEARLGNDAIYRVSALAAHEVKRATVFHRLAALFQSRSSG